MVRFVLTAFACLSMSACDHSEYTRPIVPKPHGESVRTNMAAHIINPNPPAPRPTISDANPSVLAIDAYRKGEVEEPRRDDAAASTASVNE